MNSRKSNIELLRIISIALIVCYHLCWHIHWHPLSMDAINDAWLNSLSIVFGSWGILGVDIFVIISSFYLVDKPFASTRIVKILYITSIYLIGFILIRFISNSITSGILEASKDLMLMLFDEVLQPFFCNDYWYVSAYIVLCLLIPWINRFINNASESLYKKTVIILFFIPFCSNFFVGTPLVANVANFIYIYLLVGYLKKWKFDKLLKSKLITAGTFVIPSTIMASVFLDWKLPHTGFWGLVHNFIPFTFGNINRHSLIILFSALCLFVFVLKLRSTNNRIINYIASCVFGVYLFHENPVINITKLLGDRLLNTNMYTNKIIILISFVGVVLLILILGIIIESIRQYICDKLIFKKLIKTISPLCNRIDKWLSI